MDLEKMIADINNEMKKPGIHYTCSYNQPYYSAFVAYCSLYKPKRILELGTFHGWSASAWALLGGHVDTFDIKDCGLRLPKNVSAHILAAPKDVLDIEFSDYDVIFADIDHSGVFEEKLHKIFKETYKGIVIWDDIETTKLPGMIEFWESIVDCPKIKTNWHPKHGQGIVYYE